MCVFFRLHHFHLPENLNNDNVTKCVTQRTDLGLIVCVKIDSSDNINCKTTEPAFTIQATETPRLHRWFRKTVAA